MIRKKTLVGAAALALGPLALMAPAHAIVKVGDCDPNNAANITMTLYRPPRDVDWDFTGHIGDGQGRSWHWKIFWNGNLYDEHDVTGTKDVTRILPATTQKVRFVFDNAAGTVHCSVLIDDVS